MAGVYEAVDRFLAGLVAGGVSDVVVSPGMRSTPLTLSADRRPDLSVHVVLDERSAAFVALGMARAIGKPVALICTSGTAGANYYPAIIEASLSRVPLVILTADRPPELHGWDAGQTIDQTHLYGDHAREFMAMPVGELDAAWAERSGVRAATVAASTPAGPVHVNWPFREPLEPPTGWADSTPSAAAIQSPTPLGGVRDQWIDQVVELGATERGLIVAGPRISRSDRAGIVEFALATGWPILADPLSGLRRADAPEAIATAEHVLKVSEFADAHVPDVIVRVGDSPTSKAYRLWVERHRIGALVLIDPDSRWADATASFTIRLPAPPGRLLGSAAARMAVRADRAWLQAWQSADRAAAAAITAELESGPFGEGGATRAVLSALAEGDLLHLASSMPVRDADLFMPASRAVPVLTSNRGANGIDGTISTAAGMALGARGRATVLLGDLAFIHDLGGLITAVRVGAQLTIVVLDNGGGGIFSLLPIADVAPNFEALYGTPHQIDIAAACSMAGAERVLATSPAAVTEAVGRERDGVTVVEVPIDRDANVAQIRRVAGQVAAALASLP
jgi:2-succinyl-5-enolpyruvyl-6-hydroxy-3-cyclohexene-1-carboxylate synthase